MMQRECAKYSLTLDYVDPGVLAREVQLISASGGFQAAPGRISRRLKEPILIALADKKDCLSLGERKTS
jgi:hypothetical protein